MENIAFVRKVFGYIFLDKFRFSNNVPPFNPIDFSWLINSLKDSYDKVMNRQAEPGEGDVAHQNQLL